MDRARGCGFLGEARVVVVCGGVGVDSAGDGVAGWAVGAAGVGVVVAGHVGMNVSIGVRKCGAVSVVSR